jgi:purine-nucleoside/S-methyl-5'-thioadenosine phosphorylase / adenosine deaminase
VPANESGLMNAEVLARNGFVHGFTTRQTDLTLALQALGIDERRFYQASQVHGAAVVVADGEPARIRTQEADALVARAAGAAVSVRVADCVPVLVGAPSSGAAAAIHAGWRGIVRGVIPRALAELSRLTGGSERAVEAGLVAAIGPCIGPCCFEVGSEVANEIAGAVSEDVVVNRRGGKAYVDLRRAVRAQLRTLGLRDEDVEDVPGCTKHEPERFFSFRRDGANAGRQLGIIRRR